MPEETMSWCKTAGATTARNMTKLTTNPTLTDVPTENHFHFKHDISDLKFLDEVLSIYLA